MAKADKTGEYYRTLSLSYAAGDHPAANKPTRNKKDKAATPPSEAEPLGSRFNFYLHPADRARLEHLVQWFTQQGQQATLSRVVKACIKYAQPSDELLAAFESVLEQDLRRKP